MQVLWAGIVLCGLVEGFVDYGSIYPKSYASGNDIVIDANVPYQTNTLKLSPSSPVLTLDYGIENAGFPFFDVLSLSAPTQIEVKYSEDFIALGYPNSDGPWTFSNGLSNTFRVETFNLTRPGHIESFFVQGGQRWQSIRLLENTTVEFAAVGFNSTASHVSVADVPGKLSTSNETYNKIWDLGARAVQVACVDAGNAPTTWNITSEGALIPGQQTAQYAQGTGFVNYTLSFTSKILRGGTGWRVVSGTTPGGAVFYLTTNYPQDTTYVNTNRTLLPPNTLVTGSGFSIVNQTTVMTGRDLYFPLNVTVEEDVWYDISTVVKAEGYEVALDGKVIAVVPIDTAAIPSVAARYGSGSPYQGTWGFGPWQDQSALYKDVVVTARNGTTLYSSPLATDSDLADYGIASQSTSVCLDGAKRDRLVWIGDFYHTGKVIGSSTARWDYILGSIDFALQFQKQDGPYKGFVPINAAMGQRPGKVSDDGGAYAGLNDYQDLFVAAIGDFFWRTGNGTALGPYWDKIKMLVSARLAYIDPYSSLVAGQDSYNFLGPTNGSAVTALFSYALRGLVPLAEALHDPATAALYNSTASTLNQAINSQLWNPDLGTYSLSLSAPTNYSLTSMAWTILSGAANASQAESMISTVLPTLRLGVGYKTASSDADSDATQLAPNTLGMLLEALFVHASPAATAVARSLLDDFWSRMVTQDESYSGASWEYLFPDGSPGIGPAYTSLAHPWGAAPTYVLPERVLGVRATSPGFRHWTFAPPVGILGLQEANGTVVTPFGEIEAGWKVHANGDEAFVWVHAPRGTRGTLLLPRHDVADCDGRRVSGSEVELRGGRKEIRLHGLRL